MKSIKFFYLIIFIYQTIIFPAKSDDIFDKGKNIFLNVGACSGCHTLADAGYEGQIGPNLNEIRPDKNRVIIAVTNGIGVMPSYEGQLTIEEIESVAHYVSVSSNK